MQSPLAMTSSGRVLGLDPVCGLKFPVFPTMWDSASTTLSRGGGGGRDWKNSCGNPFGSLEINLPGLCQGLVGSADRDVKRDRCSFDLIQATGSHEASYWKKGEKEQTPKAERAEPLASQESLLGPGRHTWLGLPLGQPGGESSHVTDLAS